LGGGDYTISKKRKPGKKFHEVGKLEKSRSSPPNKKKRMASRSSMEEKAGPSVGYRPKVGHSCAHSPLVVREKTGNPHPQAKE